MIGLTPSGQKASALRDTDLQAGHRQEKIQAVSMCLKPALAMGMRRLLYQDEARLEYGRRFWRDPAKRDRLLRHWLDDRHPYSSRFRESWLPAVDWVLRTDPGDDDRLDRDLQEKGLSLRAVVKEIPPVFGDFFAESTQVPCDAPGT